MIHGNRGLLLQVRAKVSLRNPSPFRVIYSDSLSPLAHCVQCRLQPTDFLPAEYETWVVIHNVKDPAVKDDLGKLQMLRSRHTTGGAL